MGGTEEISGEPQNIFYRLLRKSDALCIIATMSPGFLSSSYFVLNSVGVLVLIYKNICTALGSFGVPLVLFKQMIGVE